MEQRISYRDFQSVKSVAKAIDPKVRERETLTKKIQELAEQYKKVDAQINLLEQGIVQTLGFHVTDLVKKIVEPTGANDPKTGKPIKVTKYVPTERVAYDAAKKQYVITMPDPENIAVPGPDASEWGNDFDTDTERIQQEADHQETINPVDQTVL